MWQYNFRRSSRLSPTYNGKIRQILAFVHHGVDTTAEKTLAEPIHTDFALNESIHLSNSADEQPISFHIVAGT